MEPGIETPGPPPRLSRVSPFTSHTHFLVEVRRHRGRDKEEREALQRWGGKLSPQSRAASGWRLGPILLELELWEQGEGTVQCGRFQWFSRHLTEQGLKDSLMELAGEFRKMEYEELQASLKTHVGELRPGHRRVGAKNAHPNPDSNWVTFIHNMRSRRC